MATDIAFAVGVLSVLGKRVPFPLKVFLLALAVADDLGAIVVIAVFYTDQIAIEPALWAIGLLVAIIATNRAGVRSTQIYIALGICFWAAVLKSGIHATVAGVVLAMLTPSKPYYEEGEFEESAPELLRRFREARESGDHERAEQALSQLETLTQGTESPLDRLEHKLAPWSSYVIVPIFALANAGVALSGDMVSNAVSSPVTLGVAMGLVVGKPIGVLLAAWLAVRFGLAQFPRGVNLHHMIGVGLLAGIGFTVSLFVTGLAFTDPLLVDEGKVGILAASAVAGVIGFTYLWFAPKNGYSDAEHDLEDAAAALRV
jgi:NhaA family Na+:H+ antiporter